MSITKLYSEDISVSNLDRAIDFYVNTLGFEKRTDEPNYQVEKMNDFQVVSREA